MVPHEGSSPRVRGKPRIRASRPRLSRIIPARAGKTVVVLLFMSGVPDHPRACGENSGKARDRCRTWGSSPRVRGKLTEIVVSSQEERIIPARAGKTCPAPGGGARARDHPREKQREIIERARPARIIPARAGKTPSAPPTYPESPDHPRACGENDPTAAPTLWATGSSPRVRGKPTRSRPQGLPRGIIPARAGKTGLQVQDGPYHGDHPRACGENAPRRHCTQRAGGSSPRVRGKHDQGEHRPDQDRIIPARAGKT